LRRFAYFHERVAEITTTHKPLIILASASPRREQLLREMGVRFTVVQPNDVEELSGGTAPEVLAMRNSQRKARAVAGPHREALVIAADTIVVLHTVIFGKPRDMKAAVTMLERLAGKQHDVLTGVCVVHRQFDVEVTFCERTHVWMRPLNRTQIEDYFQKVNPLDKAGAYAIQEHGDLIISEISGSYSNVVGLPIEKLREEMQSWGTH
jgi:septum formation protein